VKSEAVFPAKLATLLKRPPISGPEIPTDPLDTLVQSFLLWEASTAAATAALDRFRKSFVDHNELRVELPSQVVGLLGNRYPMAEERADRIKRTLHAIFQQRHRLGLEHLADLDRRKQLAALEALDGIVPFVSARVLLFHFGQASVPVDEQTAELLRESKVAAREASAAEIALALGKSAGTVEEAKRIHLALMAFADAAWEADAKAMAKMASARSQVSMRAEQDRRVERAQAARGDVEVKPAEAAPPPKLAKGVSPAKGASPATAEAKTETRAVRSPEPPAVRTANPAAKPAPKPAVKPIAKAPAKPSAKPIAKPPAKPSANKKGK